jgi:ATP phosphoribosyltransferase
LGPTIAPIYSPNRMPSDSAWHTATITIKKQNLLAAVEYLREIGGSQIVVQPVNYVFFEESSTYKTLIAQL